MRHAKSNFKLLKPYLDMVHKCDGYAEFRTPFGFLPVRIRKSYYTDHCGDEVYSIANYAAVNRDIVFDPIIRVGVNFDEGTVRPIYYQNDYEPWETKQIYHSEMIYNERWLNELDDYLWKWLKKISISYLPVNGKALEV